MVKMQRRAMRVIRIFFFAVDRKASGAVYRNNSREWQAIGLLPSLAHPFDEWDKPV